MILKVTNINEINEILVKHSDIFIQIIDKLQNELFNKSNIDLYLIDGAIVASYFTTFYIKNINEKNLKNVLYFFYDKQIYSLYGYEDEINLFLKNYKSERNPVKNIVKYYIMVLNKENFKYDNNLLINIKNKYKNLECKNCNENDFQILKNLQYSYHLEEVYSSKDNYPYKLEMNNFRYLLKNMDNYCLFINSKPISKVNINSKSEETFQIGGVFTIKSHRKKGFSYICITEFIKYLFDKYSKLKTLQLFVKINNIPAINLYKKIGFKITNRSENVYFSLV